MVGETFERSLDDLDGGQGLRTLRLLRVSANLVEDLLGEPGGRLVLVGDSVDCGNGLILATARDQELGRLVEREEEESAHKHRESDGTQREDEVSPTPVVGLVADRGTNCAGVVRDEGPGKHTRNQSTDRPPGGQTTQDVG